MVGKKIKALVDYPDGNSVFKNEIGTIVKENNYNYVVDFPNFPKYNIPKPLDFNKYSLIEKPPICYKGDSTFKTGSKIIKALESLGGINKYVFIGDSSDFYYITGDNIIAKVSSIPEGYTLATPPEEATSIKTYGLYVGMKLKEDDINNWVKEGLNYSPENSKRSWYKVSGVFRGNRTIEDFKIIDGVVGFLVSDTMDVYLRAEGFLDFINKNKDIKETKYIVGKWYKNLGGNKECYAKLNSEVIDNKFPCNEYIRNNVYTSNGSYFEYFKDAELLTDLTKIQPYLPDGHIDKITNDYKVGDIVVCLPEPMANPEGSTCPTAGGSGYKSNWCFEIGKIDTYKTYKVIFLKGTNFGVYNNSIRHATKEETDFYRQMGEPYIVTDTPIKEKESLVGRYFKVLKNFSHYPIGTYFEIIEDLDESSCYYTKKFGSLSARRIKDGEVELMPKGFKPPELENEEISNLGISKKEYPKIAYKGGPGVRKTLESLGGVNEACLGCSNIYYFYYIDNKGIIQCNDCLPKEYTLVELDFLDTSGSISSASQEIPKTTQPIEPTLKRKKKKLLDITLERIK